MSDAGWLRASSLRWCDADEVRHAIATLMLGPAGVEKTLGEITLHPHQVDAVRRLERPLRELGGALLADAVGLGKTYVALAVARSAAHTLLVIPAALRGTWTTAIARTRLLAGTVDMVSMESLSRGRVPSATPAAPHGLVIVDEAHHFRNPATRRYRELAKLCTSARVLLLSATPVHNSRRDLEALLALFLGSRARSATAELTARAVVRRAEHDVELLEPLPRVSAAHRIDVGDDETLLDRILALPPPVPPADGGIAGALSTWSLVRQWSSSRAALAMAVRRRIARAVAMEAMLAEGTLPSTAQLAAWKFEEDVVQLALPGLLVQGEASRDACVDPAASVAPHRAPENSRRARAARIRALRRAVAAHRLGLERLLDRLSLGRDPDDDRAAALGRIRQLHPESRIVAFASYEATIASLYRRLLPSGGVAMLTARGARVSGGELTRREVLERFAPRASGVMARGRAGDVRLLLATELLAEGVNLQDADVVVHLDMPWSPARLEQRVGRVRRLGGSATVHVYALAPPAAAERLLEVERRLSEKLGHAAAVVGVGPTMLASLAPIGSSPGPMASPGSGSAPERTSEVEKVLRGWRRAADELANDRATSPPMACMLPSVHAGFVAVVEQEAAPRILLASVGGSASAEPSLLLRALTLASGASTPIASHDAGCGSALSRAMDTLEEWARAQRLDGVCQPWLAELATARRAVLRRLSTIERRLPRHQQGARAALIARARAAVLLPMGAHLERRLEELASAAHGDLEMLEELAALADRIPDTAHAEPLARSHMRLRALIVLVNADAIPTAPASPASATRS